MSRKKTETNDRLDEKVYQIEYLKPSHELNPREVEIWDYVVRSMKPAFFIEADRLLIVEFIKLKQLSDLAYTEMKDYDYPLSSPEATKLINAIAKTAGAMSTISQKLGIAPSSRVRHEAKTNKPDFDASTLDDLLD